MDRFSHGFKKEFIISVKTPAGKMEIIINMYTHFLIYDPNKKSVIFFVTHFYRVGQKIKVWC